jgi:uncharacterized alpha/beta hydrolase family protein
MRPGAKAELKPLDAATVRFEFRSASGHSASAAVEPYSAWFRRVINMLHDDYNMTAAEMLGLIADRGTSE